MGNLWNDIKRSLQSFFRNPSFTITAVAVLALGIGANTAIFSVVNTVLLKPLTYPNANRMVNFLAHSSGLAIYNSLHSIPEFTSFSFQRQTNLFQEVVAYDNAGPGLYVIPLRIVRTTLKPANVYSASFHGRLPMPRQRSPKYFIN